MSSHSDAFRPGFGTIAPILFFAELKDFLPDRTR